MTSQQERKDVLSESIAAQPLNPQPPSVRSQPEDKAATWLAAENPAMRFGVQVFLLFCGCILIFLAEQAHEIHVQTELKAFQQHLNAYTAAVGESKKLWDQAGDQQGELDRLHKSFDAENNGLDKLKKNFVDVQAASDALDAKVKGTFESFSSEIALIRAQTTPDGKSEEIFEAQRFPLLWDEVKQVLERVDKAKPEQIAKLTDEITYLQAKLKTTDARINSMNALLSQEHSKRLATLQSELKALKEPLPVANGTNVPAHNVSKVEPENASKVDKGSEKTSNPQEKHDQETKNESQKASSNDKHGEPADFQDTKPKVEQGTKAENKTENGSEKPPTSEDKHNEADGSMWNAREILKQAGRPLNASSTAPKKQSDTSGKTASPQPSQDQCPDSCGEKAHSCWLVRPDSSGTPVGKCFIGTGKLSGHTKDMTQEICEGRGGLWCKRTMSRDLEEAMARDPGAGKLAAAVKAALASKHENQPQGASAMALQQEVKENRPTALRKRPTSHIPKGAVDQLLLPFQMQFR
jgi:hypothetical protein